MPILLPLIPVAIALIALLIIYGLRELGKIIANMFPSTIGFSFASIHPRQWVLDAVDGLASAAQWIIGDVIRPMINLVAGPVLRVIAWLVSHGEAIGQAAAGYLWLVESGIPNLAARLTYGIHLYYGLARSYALSLYRSAIGEAEHLYNVAWANWVAADTVVLHAAEHLYNLAIGYTNSALRDALGEASNVLKLVDAEIANAETGIVKYVGQVGADVLKAADTFAVTAASQAVGTLVTDVDVVLAPVATGLIDDVGSLVGVLATDFPDVSSLVRSIDLTKVGELAGALVGTMTIARALTRLAEDCTVPNCRNLSQYGRELQALLNLVGDASFLALIIELIHSPAQAAQDVNDLFGGIVGDTLTAARDLIGV